jgi:ribonuclease HI
MTVNDAEYSGLLLCFDLRKDLDRGRLTICGDSNLVIRRMNGEIDCMAHVLTPFRAKALHRLKDWPDHDLFHVKWNASADSLASAALQREGGVVLTEDQGREDLVMLNRLPKIRTTATNDTTLKIAAMATRSRRSVSNPRVLQEEAARRLSIDLIRQSQDKEQWIANLKLVPAFPDRPTVPLAVDDADRLDFDEALFTEDSWDRVLEEGEYKVGTISDVKTDHRSRYGRTLREFKMHWRSMRILHGSMKRISTAAHCCLNAKQDRAKRNRFQVMQSHEEA